MPEHSPTLPHLTPQQWSNQQQSLQAQLHNPDRPAALQVGTHIALGNLYYEVARYQPAHDHYVNALKLSPHSLDARFGYANALRHLGRYDEAIASYDIAIAQSPQRPELWINRGRAHQHSGYPEAAIADYETALKLTPDDYRVWQRRGDLLYSLDRYGGAVISYAQALFTQPLKAEEILRTCLFLASPGPYVKRYQDAFLSLDHQLATQPNHAPTWKAQGQALAQFGFWLEAWASYGRAIALKPRAPELLVLQAQALEQLERWDEAKANYRQALAHYLQQNDLVGEDRCRRALSSLLTQQTYRPPTTHFPLQNLWKTLRWGRL